MEIEQLPFETDLKQSMVAQAKSLRLPAGETLMADGAFVAGVPIVLRGLVKVTRFEADRELLLYYIRPGESCVMSFAAALHSQPSQVVATTEQDTELLLIPAEQLPHWHRRFPRLQRYFIDLYDQRYQGLIQTIDQLAFQKLDERLLAYLHQKQQLTGTADLRLTHQQIAADLGTTREVISRVLKKLERSGHLILSRQAIVMQ
jgi:CRP/FNR family transcriptional regulator, anaerobic regulatory protein